MNRNRILPACAILAMLGGAQPGWADEGHHDSHAYSGGHGCCRQMMGHHARAGEHLHHLLSQQIAIGLTEEQVKKLNAIWTSIVLG